MDCVSSFAWFGLRANRMDWQLDRPAEASHSAVKRPWLLRVFAHVLLDCYVETPLPLALRLLTYAALQEPSSGWETEDKGRCWSYDSYEIVHEIIYVLWMLVLFYKYVLCVLMCFLCSSLCVLCFDSDLISWGWRDKGELTMDPRGLEPKCCASLCDHLLISTLKKSEEKEISGNLWKSLEMGNAGRCFSLFAVFWYFWWIWKWSEAQHITAYSVKSVEVKNDLCSRVFACFWSSWNSSIFGSMAALWVQFKMG